MIERAGELLVEFDVIEFVVGSRLSEFRAFLKVSGSRLGVGRIVFGKEASMYPFTYNIQQFGYAIRPRIDCAGGFGGVRDFPTVVQI